LTFERRRAVNMTDWKDAGPYGLFSLTYHPESQRVEVGVLKDGSKKNKVFNVSEKGNQIVFPGYEMKEKLKPEEMMIGLLTGIKLSIMDGQFELVAIGADEKWLNFLLIMKRGGERWAKVEFML
jgi:hypothetical protein